MLALRLFLRVSVLFAMACGAPQRPADPVELAVAPVSAPASASSVGAVTFQLATEGADVTLICDCRRVTRKKIPMFPIRVTFLDPDEHWQLRATKSGFFDYVEDIQFERGATEKTIMIRLRPKTDATP